MIDRRRTVTLLALTAAVIVAQEVLLTRVLSVTTWYSLAFVVINLAMLGLTAGSLQAARAERDGKELEPWLARRMIVLGAGLLAADAITVFTPLSFHANVHAFASMLVVVGANTIPLIAGGGVIARIMSRGGVPIPVLYAVDLVAAAAGALMPLAILGPLSGPSAIALLAAISAAGSWLIARRRSSFIVVIAALAVIAVPSAFRIHLAKDGAFIDTEQHVIEMWNPLSYVYATRFAPQRLPVLWAASPRFVPRGAYSTSVVKIDADAWTPIHAYRDPAELTFFRYDGVFAAHWLRPRGTACVIGTGGGRDVLAALHFGHPRVFGIEINPAMNAILRRVADASPLIRDPRVQIVTGDGRAVLARTNVQCSVLQASLIDTWAATSAGAFAHTEATVYTREAWSLFLQRVEPDGILTFSRWYNPQHIGETARLISLSVASLLDRGVKNPRDHLAVLASTRCATILVSPRAFSPVDRAALERLERDLQLTLLVAPGRRAADPLIERLLDADSIRALKVAGLPSGLDTSAPTDDRPFFFQLLAPRAWIHPISAMRTLRQSYGVGGGVIPGNVTAMIGMMLMLLAVTIIGAILLGPTLVASLRSPTPPLPGVSAWIYFGALGAGFMIAEIAFMQRMHVVLGHPTYSLIVVLASLLVATGIGSALSTTVIRSRADVSVVAGAAAVLLAILPLVIGSLAPVTADAPLSVRASWTGSCAAGAGLLLGMLFPSGLRFTNRERGAPAALAVNGVTSVLGGGAAVMVSVTQGIPASFMLAAFCYLVAALAGPFRWRSEEITHGSATTAAADDSHHAR